MSEQLPPGNTPSPVNDGRSPVAGAPRRELSTGTKFGLMGLLGVLALGFIWFNALYSHKGGTQEKPEPSVYTNGGEQFAAPPAAVTKPIQAASALPTPVPQQASYFGASNQQSPASAPIMAFSGGGTAAPPPIPPASETTPGGGGPEAGSGSLDRKSVV